MVEIIRRMRGKSEQQEPIFDVNTVEDDIAEALQRAPARRDTYDEEAPLRFAPPAVRTPALPLPAYVEPDPDVSAIGAATAAAQVTQIESCAKEIDGMLADLGRVKERALQVVQDCTDAEAYMAQTAAAYRAHAAIKFKEIEDSAKLVAEVVDTAKAMRKRIE